MLSSAFYRNKAAYVVGKIINGHDELPFVVPVLHDEDGRLALDAVAARRRSSINVLFSLSRAYFMVDMEVPSGYVEFLRSMMPTKPRSELYTMIGLGKQGKTLFYRDLLHHLHHSEDTFVEAPGIRGKVMLVFTLPVVPVRVQGDQGRVRAAARTPTARPSGRSSTLVKHLDRVGRMADTLEFTNLALPRDALLAGAARRAARRSRRR